MNAPWTKLSIFIVVHVFIMCTDVNQPTKTKPIITTQNIVCHKVECGKSSGNTAMSLCAKTITTNLIPTQPTIANAAF